jgi:CTP synthase
MSSKFIFITGGVFSSLGKGIVAASLAKLLQERGYRVTIQKFDPYINVDPGTLNPYEHGECYVTEDGAETDLDLGHYERFLNVNTSQANNVTTGRVYQTVIENERNGVYLGKTVQIIPHITDEIKRRIKLLGEVNNYDIVITEFGGTVGDIESLPYIEALRQLKWEMGDSNCINIHLTYLPYLNAAKELKSKPTQHSVKELLSEGVQPDVLVCRTEHQLTEEIRRKLALFCNVAPSAVIEALDAPSIYDVPLLLLKEKLDKIVLQKLKLPLRDTPELVDWKNFLNKMKSPTKHVKIGLIGKYVELQDAYKSILEALAQGGAMNECRVEIVSIHSDFLNDETIKRKLSNLDGILVAPGFGWRGIEGKIEAVRFARESKVPFLGICLGMQMAVIEFARNVLGLKKAHSIEMDEKTPHPVIDMMDEQKKITQKGGTMRLGAYSCAIEKNTKAYSIYGKSKISERHRHRYEFNNKYKEDFEKKGMVFSGINPDTQLAEIVELPTHPWFVAVQYHPEYKSTVECPHPLFVRFIKAAIEYNEKGK